MDTCTDRKIEKRQTYLNGETTLSSGVYCTYCILGRSVKITYVPTLQIAYCVGWVHTMLSGSILYEGLDGVVWYSLLIKNLAHYSSH